MAIIHVNKIDVERFEICTKNMIDKSNDLKNIIHILNTLINNINEQNSKSEKNLAEVEDSLKRILLSISKLNNKIKITLDTIGHKKTELSHTPKTIPTKTGPIPNPYYIKLEGDILKLEAYLVKLKIMSSKCVESQTSLNLHKCILETIIKNTKSSIKELDSFKETICHIMSKINSNSINADDILKKIIEIIDDYISIKKPITDIYNYKDNIVKAVNSHEIELGSNGSYWAKETGNYGEIRTSLEFQNQGFMEMTKSPMTLNDKLQHGIDHIFYKDDKYYIVDSKSGRGAHLETMTATGPQLSDSWIDARLDGAVGKDVADIIREKMLFDDDSTVRIVSKVDLDKETIYGLVDSNGNILKEAGDINALFK